jgi:hypothetical protein
MQLCHLIECAGGGGRALGWAIVRQAGRQRTAEGRRNHSGQRSIAGSAPWAAGGGHLDRELVAGRRLDAGCIGFAPADFAPVNLALIG